MKLIRRTVSAAVALAVIAAAYGLLNGDYSLADLESALSTDLPSAAGGAVASDPAPGASQVGGAPELTAQQARTRLAVLATDPQDSYTGGYEREDFDHWQGAADNGFPPSTYAADPGYCDARDATLIRDGAAVEVGDYCAVGSGSWADPFTGAVITDSSEIDIDHVVPLSEAYQSGAANWPAYKKADYANDPLVLAATDSSENVSKSDQRPDEWLPPYEGSHCSYAKRWIQVKHTYSLSVVTPERDTLQQALNSCPQPA